MRNSIHALFIAAASFALATCLAAAPAKPVTVTESGVKAEQRIATAMIGDAVNDLTHSSNAYGNGTYKYAWVYLTDCGVKLDQTKAKLKDHPARIQVALNFFGFTIGSDTRADLTKKYYKIKDDLERAYQKMSALEVDLGKKLGVDVASVRKIMSTFQILCETTKDPKYCEAYARLKGLLDSGDIAGLAQAIDSMGGLLNDARSDAQQNGVDVEIPTNTHVTTSSTGGSMASSTGSSAASILSSISPNDPNRSAYENAISALERAAAAGDTSAQARLQALQQASADCANGVPGGCERLRQLLSSLVTPAVSAPAASSGPVRINVGGEELTFVDGKAIKTVYIGGRGMRLKKEVVIKIVDPNTNPPTCQEVSSRDWNLVVQNSTVQSTATGAVVRFSLIEEGGRSDFTVKSWTVTSASGAILQSGSSLPADVTVTEQGTVTVEVKGVTELGSDFTVRSTVEISF
jgi:hypothetical protein